MDAVLAVIILSIGVAVGIAEQNDLFGAYLFSLAAMACLFPLALIVTSWAAICWWMRPRMRRLLCGFTITAWSLVLAVMLCVFTGGFINRWKVDAVNSYVTRAATILDGIKAKIGSYPQKLPVDVLGEPPTLLRDYGSYTSDGQSFQFEYIDEPAGWAGGEGFLQFSSSDREWSDER